MKDAYYFSHDSNARYDPKILSMISVYGMTGYGWYWVIIEILRDLENYKFNTSKEHSYNAIAMQCFTDCPTMKKFIYDCVNEFDLFLTDDECFWSESLSNRMEYFDEKKQKRIDAARIGGLNSWNSRSKRQATVEQPLTITQVNKVKESKVKNINTLSVSKETDEPKIVKPSKEPKKINTSYPEILSYWNSKEIIVHKVLSTKSISLIKSKLESGYSLNDIKEAIKSYWFITTNTETKESYWFTYKFTLEDFLNPKNFEKFKDFEAAHTNFLIKEEKRR